ncbi:MAG: hypothetical protein K0S27_1511 [Gammaproteobacteria bacterium]|jgi:hypothetical protein|nr:hypothetical protein [Gammaproteobacteria bacterium]
MNISSHVFSDDIYILKEGLTHQQLSAAINRCLCQAEALTVIATLADAEAIIKLDTMNNYLWALSDIVQETQYLYENLANQH